MKRSLLASVIMAAMVLPATSFAVPRSQGNEMEKFSVRIYLSPLGSSPDLDQHYYLQAQRDSTVEITDIFVDATGDFVCNLLMGDNVNDVTFERFMLVNEEFSLNLTNGIISHLQQNDYYMIRGSQQPMTPRSGNCTIIVTGTHDAGADFFYSPDGSPPPVP